MEITFLGTGTSQGVPVIGCDCVVCQSADSKDKRLRASIMVTVGGENIVVDTGPDFRYQLLREGVKDVEAILLTHEHRDHIAGLDDIRPFNFLHSKNMPVYASERVQKSLHSTFNYIFTPPFYPGVPKIELHTIRKEDRFQAGSVDVIPLEVLHHKMPVLGFRFGDFTYITDAKTIADEELEKVRGTKVLVLNALRKKTHMSHLNIEEALDWIVEIRPEKTYLTHISHMMGRHEEVQNELPAGVFLAYDRQKVHL